MGSAVRCFVRLCRWFNWNRSLNSVLVWIKSKKPSKALIWDTDTKTLCLCLSATMTIDLTCQSLCTWLLALCQQITQTPYCQQQQSDSGRLYTSVHILTSQRKIGAWHHVWVSIRRWKRITNHSHHGLFCTISGLSYLGHFVYWTFHTITGIFIVPWTIRTVILSFQSL